MAVTREASRGLLASVAWAVRSPMMFWEVARDVRDDWGGVSDRQLSNALAILVDRGVILAEPYWSGSQQSTFASHRVYAPAWRVTRPGVVVVTHRGFAASREDDIEEEHSQACRVGKTAVSAAAFERAREKANANLTERRAA